MQAVPVILQRTVRGERQTITSSDLGTIIKAEVGDTIPASDGLGSWTVVSRVKINMWALFKPVRIPDNVGDYTLYNTVTSAEINLTTKLWKRNATNQWWRDTLGELAGATCKYGIFPRLGANLAAVFAHYTNGRDWTYIKPVGNGSSPNSPYRLTDFVEYKHDAEQPLGSISAPTSLILSDASQGGWVINVAMMKSQDDDKPIYDANDPTNQRDYVIPEDILKTVPGWNGACHFGFALIDSNGVAKIWVTGNRYYGTGTNHGLLSAGTYSVMPFYTNTELPQQTEEGSNLNPTPMPIPAGTYFATVPNVQLPQLIIPGTSVDKKDARFSVKAVLQNGRVQVTAIVNAADMAVTGGSISFYGGTYNQVIIYVCKAGTTVGSGRPASTDILAQESFYTQANPLVVYSGSTETSSTKKTIGGGTQSYTVSAEKCRVYVYASPNGSAQSNDLVARAMCDAMVSEGTIVPSDEVIISNV